MSKGFPRSAVNFSETNPIFILFQFNGLVLLLSSIITGVKQHVGNPIDCIYDGILEQQKSFVDSYCWKNYEPIVPHVTPIFVPFAAVNKDLQVYSSNPFTKRQSSYYQWLPLILLFQSILAFVPSWLWSIWRDKRLHVTISSIKEPHRQPSRRKLLIMNLANDLICTESIQRRYAKPFFLCEILNVISFLLNVLITSFLFQHRFIMYGIDKMGSRFARERGSNPSDSNSELFPTFARCSVQLANKENGIQKEEAICMISFNTVCETIFMFLWVWFLLVTLTSLIGILHRIFMMLSKRKRKSLLMEAVDSSYGEKLSTISDKLGFCSWFTLYRISRNVDPLTFQDIIFSLMARIDSSAPCRIGKPTSTVTHLDRKRLQESSVVTINPAFSIANESLTIEQQPDCLSTIV